MPVSRSKEFTLKQFDEEGHGGGAGALAHASAAVTRSVLQFVFGDLKVRRGASADRIEEAVKLLEAGELDHKIRQQFVPESLLEAEKPGAFEDVKPFNYAEWKARHSR